MALNAIDQVEYEHAIKTQFTIKNTVDVTEVWSD